MPLEIVRRYTRDDIRANPHKLFIFGDNIVRSGYGGQAAAARGEPNAVGVVTKRASNDRPDAYLSDDDYVNNVLTIMRDLNPALAHLAMGGIVVWPADGIGTGRAQLHVHAPLTLRFIDTLVDAIKQVYGVVED